eukprot:11943462-Alexandrium_andersonii.AAC.1
MCSSADLESARVLPQNTPLIGFEYQLCGRYWARTVQASNACRNCVSSAWRHGGLWMEVDCSTATPRADCRCLHWAPCNANVQAIRAGAW